MQYLETEMRKVQKLINNAHALCLMSVFKCDKTRFKFQLVFSQLRKSYFGKLFRQCRDISGTFLKPFKKLVVPV